MTESFDGHTLNSCNTEILSSRHNSEFVLILDLPMPLTAALCAPLCCSVDPERDVEEQHHHLDPASPSHRRHAEGPLRQGDQDHAPAQVGAVVRQH